MKIKSKPAWLAMLVLFSLALAGCAGSTFRPEQPERSRSARLDNQHPLGQTLTAHYAGLEGLRIYLSPLEAGDGQIVLHLKSGPGTADDIRSASLPLSQVDRAGYYAFDFTPLANSNRQDYYIELEVQGSGSLEAGTADGAAYLSGALYQDGQAKDAQLTFGLGYDRALQLRGLLGEGLTWALWLLAGLVLYVLPGWALLDALWVSWGGLRFWEKFGLAAGASLAIYPLLFVWTDLVGLHLGPLYAWLPPLVGLGWLVWRRRGSFRCLPERLRQLPGSLKNLQSSRALAGPGHADYRRTSLSAPGCGLSGGWICPCGATRTSTPCSPNSWWTTTACLRAGRPTRADQPDLPHRLPYPDRRFSLADGPAVGRFGPGGVPAAERAGGGSALSAGEAAGPQPLGRCAGGAAGRADRSNAHVLPQLGALHPAGRAGNITCGSPAGLGQVRYREPGLAADGFVLDHAGGSGLGPR